MVIVPGPALLFHTSAKCARLALFADVTLVADAGEHAERGPCGRRDGRSGECMFVLILASMIRGRGRAAVGSRAG